MLQGVLIRGGGHRGGLRHTRARRWARSTLGPDVDESPADHGGRSLHRCVELSRRRCGQSWRRCGQSRRRAVSASAYCQVRRAVEAVGERLVRVKELVGGKADAAEVRPSCAAARGAGRGEGGRGGCTVSSRRCMLYVATCSSLRSSARSAVHWRRCAVQRAAQP
jgi:hypothetical protein